MGDVVVSVPPQVAEVLLATVKPVGSVSVNATPASGSGFAAGFVIVNVSDVVAFSAIADGLNALAIEGGPSTWIVAVLLGSPVPPSVELTGPVVLFWMPAAVPVTFTLKLQEPLAAIVPPDKVMVFVFCVAVMVPLPQEPVRPFGVEIINPAGNVSVNETPDRAIPLGLLMVKLRLVEPFNGILAAPNALLIVAAAATVMLALDVFPFPPSVEVMVTLLLFNPGVVPLMSTDTVQDWLAASVPPDKLTEDDPLAAVAVPPQVLFRFGVDATSRPEGRLSVKANPFNATPVFGLLMVNVSDVVPFTGMDVAPNAF